MMAVLRCAREIGPGLPPGLGWEVITAGVASNEAPLRGLAAAPAMAGVDCGSSDSWPGAALPSTGVDACLCPVVGSLAAGAVVVGVGVRLLVAGAVVVGVAVRLLLLGVVGPADFFVLAIALFHAVALAFG